MIETVLNIKSQGVYQITNIVNDKIYIGSCYSNNFHERWGKHKERLRKGKHSNRHLQSAWSKYGEDNFIFHIIEELPKNKSLIQEREQEYLDTKIEFGYDYNMLEIAGGGGNCKLSESQCIEILNTYVFSNNIIIKDLEQKYKVSNTIITKILNGRYFNCRNIDPKLIEKSKAASFSTAADKLSKNQRQKRTLTEEQAGQIKWLYQHVGANKKMCRYFNVNDGSVWRIGKGKTYVKTKPLPCPDLLELFR